MEPGFPRWLSGKDSACNSGATEDMGSIPGSGRTPGGGHGNPLHCSCLQNPMDREAWWVLVHRVPKSQTWLKQLSIHAWRKNTWESIKSMHRSVFSLNFYFIFYFFKKLKYGCFTVFQVYSKVNQLYIIYMFISLFIFLSIRGFYKILNMVPCAIQ